MTYIVLELQTTNGVTANIVNSYTDINDAESKYHDILRVAAKSGLEAHGATILTYDGRMVRNECYKTNPEPAMPSVG